MSNNTRRPPSGGTYSNGRGRTTSPTQQRRTVPQQPRQQPPQQQPKQKQLVISTKRMWLYCGCCALLALVMLITKHPLGAIFLLWCAAILSPIYERIILKAEDPRSMIARVLTNRPLRCGLALIVGVITTFAVLFSGCAKAPDNEPDIVIPAASATATPATEATPTTEPTATPTATPEATPTATPESTPTSEPTATPTKTPEPTEAIEEGDDEEKVWIPTNGGTRYHSKETCSKMEDPEYVTLEEAKSLGFTACGRCYK